MSGLNFDATVLAACMGAFGEPVVYYPAQGPAIALSGIFEVALKELRVDKDGAMVDAAHPVLGLRLSDLVAGGMAAGMLPERGETFLIRGEEWQIADAPGPDSEGHLRLALMRASDS
jgi:hypothetical protein